MTSEAIACLRMQLKDFRAIIPRVTACKVAAAALAFFSMVSDSSSVTFGNENESKTLLKALAVLEELIFSRLKEVTRPKN